MGGQGEKHECANKNYKKVEPEQEIKVGDKYCCIDKESYLYGEILTVFRVVDACGVIFISKKGTTWGKSFEEIKQHYKKVEQ